MIMQNLSGDGPRKPASDHPWRTPRTQPENRQNATATTAKKRHNRKATIALTAEEEKAIRARALRAGGLSVSAFIRAHFPPELLTPPGDNDEDNDSN